MKYCLHNGIIINGLSMTESPSAILIDDNKIIDVFSEHRFLERSFGSDVKIIDLNQNFVLPGLIDTHIHGFMGHGTDICTAEGILKMSENLAQYGVTSFNPTMYPSDIDEMEENLRTIVSVMGKEKGAHIMGIHLEGPFISEQKLGVQRAETVMMPDINIMNRLWEASEGHIVNMTVAPELQNMRELALDCINKGIVLQAGHTNAQYENMMEGIQIGILHSTHFFNAMSQLHHRNPGAVGAILTHPETSCEIIADGIHVHPALFNLLAREKTVEQIVLVTDALTPTEQTTGTQYANGEEVILQDGCFKRKKDGVIAGSALTLIKAVRNTVQFGYQMTDAVRFATANPARVMHYSHKGVLAPTYDSDIIVIDKDYNIRMVMISGEITKNNLEN